MFNSVQLRTLRGDIEARSLLGQSEEVIAGFYTQAASPQFTVWKTSVAQADLFTGFVWTEMDALSQNKFNQLTLMLSAGPLNPSVANIRQGILDVFSSASLSATRANLVSLAKRPANIAEKMFATGSGTAPSPGFLVYEGPVTVSDVQRALAKP